MGFTPNIPTPDESLNDSRPEISGNFQSLREAFSVEFTGDHVDPNDAEAGKHWWVRMLDVGLDIPPTADSQFSFYVKPISLGGPPQIFYKTPAGLEVRVTSDVTTGVSGRSVPVIGGFVMKVGSFNIATGTNTRSWNTETGSNFGAIPVYYNVSTDNTGNKSAVTGPVTATDFTFSVGGAAANPMYYIAIGVPV